MQAVKSPIALQLFAGLRHLLKAIIPVVGVVFLLALGPNALAHGLRDPGVRIPDLAELQHPPESPALSASYEGATAYLEATGPKSVEADSSKPCDPISGHCDHRCCCAGTAYCASCSGAIVAVEVLSQLIVPKAQLSLSATRAAAGTPLTPADPPPRALI